MRFDDNPGENSPRNSVSSVSPVVERSVVERSVVERSVVERSVTERSVNR